MKNYFMRCIYCPGSSVSKSAQSAECRGFESYPGQLLRFFLEKRVFLGVVDLLTLSLFLLCFLVDSTI